MPVTATPREGTFIRRWGGMFGYRFVVLIAVALVMAVLAVAYAVQSSRRQVRAETEAAHLTQAIAIGPADQVTRTVDAVGFVLSDLMARAQRGEAQALSPDMSNLVQDMPQLRGILILDGHGRVVEAMPAALRERDFGGSAWFKELLAIREAGAIGVLRVVGPQPGRLLDEPTGEGAWRRWTIPLALARPAAGGIQGEFAVALLNPEYLTAIAATPGDAFGVDIRLYGFDGALLAHDDGRNEAIGRRLPENWLFRDFLPRREAGSFTGTDAFQREVTASFAVSRQVPIVIEVAQSRRDIMEPVREQLHIFLLARSSTRSTTKAGAVPWFSPVRTSSGKAGKAAGGPIRSVSAEAEARKSSRRRSALTGRPSTRRPRRRGRPRTGRRRRPGERRRCCR